MIRRALALLSRFTQIELVALSAIVSFIPLYVIVTIVAGIAEQSRPAFVVLGVYLVAVTVVAVMAVYKRYRLYRDFREQQRRSHPGNAILGEDDLSAGWGRMVGGRGEDQRFAVRTVYGVSSNRFLKWGLRTRAPFALDVVAHHATSNRFDFAGLVDVAILSRRDPDDARLMLPTVNFSAMVGLCRLAIGADLDEKVIDGLLTYTALHADDQDPEEVLFLARLLLLNGHRDDARRVLRRSAKTTWVRQLLVSDLLNPFVAGNEHDDDHVATWLLSANEPFRTSGLEGIRLSDDMPDGADIFDRITVDSHIPAVSDGPLVTIIMTTYQPDIATETAVRSIIGQSYQNWELLIMDDASGVEWSAELDALEALDERISVIRATDNAGTYVRRNEAILRARGEFVTMQDSDDWCHPRRLELQVNHLHANPSVPANTVYAMRVSREMLFVQPRGVQLRLSEPAIMYRRQMVHDRIGYFDSVRRGADTEFRLRLQETFGVEVAPLPTAAPLVLMRFDFTSLSGSDFADGWTHPARFSYRAAHKLWRQRERKAGRTPYMPFPIEERPFPAPPRLTGVEHSTSTVDLLVIADGREKAAPAEFGTAVLQEIRAAHASGAVVGFMHIGSLRKTRTSDEVMGELQAAINDGYAIEFAYDEPVTARRTVVRHASALLGAPMLPERSVATDEVVVVLDRAYSIDQRGVNYTPGWINRMSREYLGLEPRWVTVTTKGAQPLQEL